MRAFSIGFRGLEGKYEERENKKVWTWTKIELLEVSPVAVPANRGALARANGYFESEDAKDAIAETVRDEFTKLQSFIDQKLDDLNSVIIAERGELGDSLLGDSLNLPASGGDEAKTAERIIKTCKEISNTAKT
jgi:hypothetical protein